MKKFSYFKALFSPFKPFSIKWYIGKTAIGTPYFYPRKWVKATPELASKATASYMEREENYNKLNPNYARKIRTYDEVYQENMQCTYPVPKKIGFDVVSLGYKTKWSHTDFRFECPPLISFVFFGYQIAAIIVAPEQEHYWEAWLYYDLKTDPKKSKRERIKDCKSNFPLDYTITTKSESKKVNYYDTILREKYRNL